MSTHKDLDLLPEFPNAVITTGSFDGVHCGHALIIEQLKAEAEKQQGKPVLITFFPHPKHVVTANANPLFVLNTLEEKEGLLREKGIEHIVVVPFDKSFAALSAKEYIEKFLVARFHPVAVVIGHDHRFGNNREGDFAMLNEAGKSFGFAIKEIPAQVMQDVTVSSTKIREALLRGDVANSSSLLGYDYFFSGKVIEGNKLGRTIGYPTANIRIADEHKLVPANGVYAVTAAVRGEVFNGMMNIGVRPTVDGINRVIEVNIFDFNKDIYGEEIKITLQHRLRDEVKFAGLDELKRQLGVDQEMARRLLHK